MRLHSVWHRVGPPTWRRSGTIAFTAVIGVLLVGGTAMAANLGLLTSTAPGDRGYRLEVPRPPLSVSLPPTTSTETSVDSTAASADPEAKTDDGPELQADDPADASSAHEGDRGGTVADDGRNDDSESDREADTDDRNNTDDTDDTAESTSEPEPDGSARGRSESGRGHLSDLRPRPDGGLDDD